MDWKSDREDVLTGENVENKSHINPELDVEFEFRYYGEGAHSMFKVQHTHLRVSAQRKPMPEAVFFFEILFFGECAQSELVIQLKFLRETT